MTAQPDPSSARTDVTPAGDKNEVEHEHGRGKRTEDVVEHKDNINIVKKGSDRDDADEEEDDEDEEDEKYELAEENEYSGEADDDPSDMPKFPWLSRAPLKPNVMGNQKIPDAKKGKKKESEKGQGKTNEDDKNDQGNKNDQGIKDTEAEKHKAGWTWSDAKFS